jgi:hypothetical protein
MSSQLESIYSDELILLAETLGEVKTRTEKLEGEFSTHAKPLEAATNALSAALSGIKALQFHVLDNNLGALSARVEEMRKAVDEQVGVIALELKKADETNAAKAGADAEALRSEIVGLQSQLGSLVTQFGQQLERVEFAAKEEAKKLQLIPGPAGAAGASLNPRGTFIDGEVYNRLDVVSWLGSSYIATVDGVTEKPSKNSNQWQTLASRGGGGAGGVGDFGSLAGVAQINQGGTGQTTRAAGLNALLPDQAGSTQYMLLTDGSGTVSWGAQPVAGLPSQTSNGGKLLTTDGTNASWSNAVTVSGSNATVTGTLTVNSTSTFNNTITVSSNVGFIGKSGSGTGGNWRYISDDGTSRWLSGILGSPSETAFDIYDIVNGRSLLTLTAAGVVKVPQTTASTTTSSGALVVSGGVGVGGAANIGGALTVSGTGGIGASASGDVGFKVLSSLTSGSFQYGIYSYPTVNAGTADGGLFGVRAGTSVAVTTAFALRAFTPTLDSGASIASNIGIRVENQGATGITNAFGIDILAQSGASTTNVGLRNAGTTLLTNTTASNNTSSGALVVSGGVGVAGAIYAGGDVFVVKADPSSTLTRTANTNSALFQLTTGATYDFAFGLRNTTDSDFHLYNYGTSSDALTIARASSNATFAGTVIANASSNAFRITTAQTPASAAATGTAGTIAWDTSYIYVCTATNTWKRVAIATW